MWSDLSINVLANKVHPRTRKQFFSFTAQNYYRKATVTGLLKNKCACSVGVLINALLLVYATQAVVVS